MLIDIIFFALIIMAIFKGMRKGLIIAVFSFIAFIVGLAAALKLSTWMAGYIGSNIELSQRWLPFIAFFIVFILVVFLVRLGAKMLEGAIKLVMLGWLNALGGIVFYGLLYFFVFSILLFYAIQLSIIKPATIDASVTYGFIKPFAPGIINIVGDVIPFFKDMFDQLLQFFGNIKPSS